MQTPQPGNYQNHRVTNQIAQYTIVRPAADPKCYKQLGGILYRGFLIRHIQLTLLYLKDKVQDSEAYKKMLHC